MAVQNAIINNIIIIGFWAFGRAFRCNLFAVDAKRIFTSIPNAKHDKLDKKDF